MGYTEAPVFTTSAIVNGQVTVNAEGIAKFTANKNGCGSFQFTVKDATGDKFRRTIHILVGEELN